MPFFSQKDLISLFVAAPKELSSNFAMIGGVSVSATDSQSDMFLIAIAEAERTDVQFQCLNVGMPSIVVGVNEPKLTPNLHERNAFWNQLQLSE